MNNANNVNETAATIWDTAKAAQLAEVAAKAALAVATAQMNEALNALTAAKEYLVKLPYERGARIHAIRDAARLAVSEAHTVYLEARYYRAGQADAWLAAKAAVKAAMVVVLDERIARGF